MYCPFHFKHLNIPDRWIVSRHQQVKVKTWSSNHRSSKFRWPEVWLKCCCFVSTRKQLPKLRRNVVPSSSGSRGPRRLWPWPWRWRHFRPSKALQVLAQQNSVTSQKSWMKIIGFQESDHFNPLKPELNPIWYLLALLGAHHFLHVSRIRVKLLTFRRLMSYIWSTHSWCF